MNYDEIKVNNQMISELRKLDIETLVGIFVMSCDLQRQYRESAQAVKFPKHKDAFETIEAMTRYNKSKSSAQVKQQTLYNKERHEQYHVQKYLGELIFDKMPAKDQFLRIGKHGVKAVRSQYGGERGIYIRTWENVKTDKAVSL